MKVQAPFFGNVHQSAQDELMQSIEELLAANDILMGGLVIGLEKGCNCCQSQCDKDIGKLKKILIKLIIKLQVGLANDIDYLYTKIFNIVCQFNQSTYWILVQLGNKSGLLQVGGDLYSLLTCNSGDLPCQSSTPTVNLSFAGILPLFKELVEVLKEIRNRMPPEVVQLPTEDAATEVIPTVNLNIPVVPYGSPDWPEETDAEMENEI